MTVYTLKDRHGADCLIGQPVADDDGYFGYVVNAEGSDSRMVLIITPTGRQWRSLDELASLDYWSALHGGLR